MKVLVSTTETQGQRSNDFCFVPEGELLHWGSECSNETVDGYCGCRRSLSGVSCLTATTTFKVAEGPTDTSVADRIFVAYARGGWINSDSDLYKIRRYQAKAREQAVKMDRVTSQFPVGTILERRGDVFQERNPNAQTP